MIPQNNKIRIKFYVLPLLKYQREKLYSRLKTKLTIFQLNSKFDHYYKLFKDSFLTNKLKVKLGKQEPLK